jgi:hypothetical protein
MEFYHNTYASSSARGKTREIWTVFFKSYWKTFPWRLPFKQDPDAEDPTNYALPPATPEEVKAREVLIPAMEAVSRVSSFCTRY